MLLQMNRKMHSQLLLILAGVGGAVGVGGGGQDLGLVLRLSLNS